MSELWDLGNKGKTTKVKIELLRKIFNVWLTVWNGKNQIKWVDKEWYVVDLFAGRGYYMQDGSKVSGSTLIFLEEIEKKYQKIKDNSVKITVFAVEKNSKYFKSLNSTINSFIEKRPYIKDVLNITLLDGDCNIKLNEIISGIKNTKRNPLFVFIDPTGLQIKRKTIEKLVRLENPKDILFNYMLEGVRRTSGVASKLARDGSLSQKEIKTVKTLQEFLGYDIDIIKKQRPEDLEVLEAYAHAAYLGKGLCVTGYNVEYPDRRDILYYLLFITRNPRILKIVKDIYASQKEKVLGPTLFGKDIHLKSILEICPKPMKGIIRKKLLYKTKVEYGDWTINHIVGCTHGCKFPCYAMMMAKRFGWVKSYQDWRNPKIVKNALELLDKEIPKYKDKIKFVHLSFMTDPFMYDIHTQDLIPEIKELTLKIIEKLNANSIKVTTLTKGIYPDDLLDTTRFSIENEYGITLVSLNPEFKQKFEPYSAPYEKRIQSLIKLHEAGFKTWVSMEPYPTPNIDKDAINVEKILEKLSFVDKIIFGKLNYNVNSKAYENNEDFYREIARKVIDFCKRNNINYHIKFGTPY